MKLRWTDEAASDLERIADYLFDHTPDRAPDLVSRIAGEQASCRDSRTFLAPLPYVLVYCITGEVIHVVRIVHGAQKWL